MFSKKIKSLGNSLLFRLTILFTLAFTLLAIISFGIFYYQIYSLTMARMDEELLEDKIEYYSEYLARSDLESLKKRLMEEAEPEDPEEEFYRIIDFNGNVLATSDMSAWGPVDKTDGIKEFKKNEINHIFQTITRRDEGDQARMVTAVIGYGLILQIGESLEEADEYLEIFRNLFSILTGILIIASAFIGWYLARTAEDISRGSYDRRVETKSQYKEIEKLGLTFNTMLDRIQILLRSMKEINDNIAHDLRSPVARIRGIAEMMLSDDKTLSDYKEMAINTVEECDSLIEMINTMLDITEAEAGVNGTADEEFDVVEVIAEACELFRPLADEKGIELTHSLPDYLAFTGSKKKMQRIVTNILENAIKYTPEQGRVSVSAEAEKGRTKIIFNDTGVGISDNDLPHIFERFYRSEPVPGRRRIRSQPGQGLYRRYEWFDQRHEYH